MSTPLRVFKAEIFQALAHPTRIAIVEALRDGEVSAGGLLAYVQVEPANLSQHLAVLRTKQVVSSRKAGNQVYYTLRNPVLVDVLDLLKQYFNTHLQETRRSSTRWLPTIGARNDTDHREHSVATWRPKLLERSPAYDRHALIAPTSSPA